VRKTEKESAPPLAGSEKRSADSTHSPRTSDGVAREYFKYEHLDKLENQSIFIIREAFNKIERLAMLWSVGKDSQTIMWLARKAFFGHVPFPCVSWRRRSTCPNSSNCATD